MDMRLHRIDVSELLHRDCENTRGTGRDRRARAREFVDVFGIHEHEGKVRDQVLALKYRGKTGIGAHFGRDIATVARAEVPFVNQVTWAPTTRERASKRGFDQAECIARHAAAWMQLPARRLLRRVNGGSQTHASRRERLERPAFTARPAVRGHVLVVDDVVTTGATFVAACRALLAAGAVHVTCIAVSWTPPSEGRFSAGSVR